VSRHCICAYVRYRGSDVLPKCKSIMRLLSDGFDDSDEKVMERYQSRCAVFVLKSTMNGRHARDTWQLTTPPSMCTYSPERVVWIQ